MSLEHLDRDATWPNKPLSDEIDEPFLGYWLAGLTPHSLRCEYVDAATADYYLSLGNELLAQGWPVYVEDAFPAPTIADAHDMFDGIQVTWGIQGTAAKYPVTGIDAWASSVNAACRFDTTLYFLTGTYPYFRQTSGLLIHDYPHPIDYNNVWESLYSRTVARIRRCQQARKLATPPHKVHRN